MRYLIGLVIKPIIVAEITKARLAGVTIFGDPKKLILLGKNITLNNTLFNTNSGSITVHDFVDFAHDCKVITGSHDFTKKALERTFAIDSNRDIVIEEGVFIGSGVIILGSCRIGNNSVIGAGSIVTKDIPSNVIAAGNPCRVLREIRF